MSEVAEGWSWLLKKKKKAAAAAAAAAHRDSRTNADNSIARMEHAAACELGEGNQNWDNKSIIYFKKTTQECLINSKLLKYKTENKHWESLL